MPKAAKPQTPTPAPPPPERSDAAISDMAEAQRRAFQGGGRADTILSGFGSSTAGTTSAASLLGQVGK